MVRNLRYIKQLIEEYFASHLMIQAIKFGDTDNLSTYSDLNYPLVNFEYIDSNYRADQFSNTARFQFAIMDLSNDENEFDVIDNCEQIAGDFLKFLADSNDTEIQPNISLVPFADSFGDRVSGTGFTVTFNVYRNDCRDILPHVK